jgi:hypothetical protein
MPPQAQMQFKSEFWDGRFRVRLLLKRQSFHGCSFVLEVVIGTAKHAVLTVFGLFLRQSDAAGRFPGV